MTRIIRRAIGRLHLTLWWWKNEKRLNAKGKSGVGFIAEW